MEDLQLTETEKRYFSDLFVCCDIENTENIPQSKAFELFRSGSITADTLNEIIDIIQIKGGFLSRVEFYSVLKLIAASQSSLPLTADLLTQEVELPLPRFTWPATDGSTDSIGSPSSTDSPTPTNSVQERNWAVDGWSGLCEEQRQLLGTEEESSDRHSSEEDTEISSEVWSITSEQRDYYANQFKQLQPDINGLLAGNIARKFFEKSLLPTAELRKIWQLSDVTKDGMLSLEEFNTAMHLVVLRRNHIPLPLTLPPVLNPAPLAETKEAKEAWTKFIDSPTSVASPGPKPVNFDFHKASVETDPKILHPKPLRLTPEIIQNFENFEIFEPIQRPQPKKISRKNGGIPPPPVPSNTTTLPHEEPLVIKKDKPPPPPPRPIRSHGRSSSLDLNRLNKAGPPLIPPRVSPNISSPKKLINQRSEGDPPFADFEKFEAEPDDTTPTTTTTTTLPNQQSEKYENVTDAIDGVAATEPIRKHGAFEVYRKPLPPQTHQTHPTQKESPAQPPPLLPPLPVEDSAKLELYKKLKEQNLVLLRLCQELSQELADVREERTTLRLRLEQSN